MRCGLIIGALLLVASCKKETPSGLPPAAEWKASSEGAAAPHPGERTVPANPHGDMTAPNPHGDMATTPPHGDTGSDGPHSTLTPTKTDPKTLETTTDGRVVIGPFAMAAPKDWKIKPVTSSMRAADFILSDKAGEDAELIVYYFGEGGAGSVDANLDRWLGQFTQANGKLSKDVAKIEKTKFAGQEATVVSVTGHYAAAAMPGGEAVDKQDQSLLAAIVNSPSGPYYFKLVGAKKTVEANNAKFRAMLTSMKLK